MAAALSLAFRLPNSPYYSRYNAANFPPFEVSYSKIDLEEARAMRRLMDQPDRVIKFVAAALPSGRYATFYIVDQHILISSPTKEIDEALNLWTTVQRLIRWGNFFFKALAVTTFVAGFAYYRQASSHVKFYAYSAALMAFAALWRLGDKLRSHAYCARQQIDAFYQLRGERLVDQFVEMRKKAYPRSFITATRAFKTIYMHPTEVDALYGEALEHLLTEDCSRIIQKAAWVKEFLATGSALFKTANNCTNWFFKDRFEQICQSFSDFVIFHRDNIRHSPLAPFASLSKILGEKGQDRLRIVPREASPLWSVWNDPNLRRAFVECALEAWLKITPNTEPLLQAHEKALEYDAAFFSAARAVFEFARGFGDPPKEFQVLPTKFDPPEIPAELATLEGDKLLEFIKTAKQLKPAMRQEFWEEYLTLLQTKLND